MDIFQLTCSQKRDFSRMAMRLFTAFQLTRSHKRDVQLTDTDIVTSFDTVCANVFLCSAS